MSSIFERKIINMDRSYKGDQISEVFIFLIFRGLLLPVRMPLIAVPQFLAQLPAWTIAQLGEEDQVSPTGSNSTQFHSNPVFTNPLHTTPLHPRTWSSCALTGA